MKRLKTLIIFTGVWLITCQMSVCQADDTWWEHTYLGSGRTFELTSKGLCADSQGQLHLTYGESGLFYAIYNGSTWNVESVDDMATPGYGAAIQVDSQGVPWICYIDQYSTSLIIAHKQTDQWSFETIDYQVQAGVTAAFKLDEYDHPHIGYARQGEPDQLVYGSKLNNQWTFQELGELHWKYSPSMDCRLLLNNRNEPYIQCGNSGFYLLDNEWREYPFPSHALAIDENRMLHNLSVDSRVKYSHMNPAGTVSETQISSSGSVWRTDHNGVLMLQENNEVHAFYLQTETAVKHAWRSGLSWRNETVYTMPGGGGSVVAAVKVNDSFHCVTFDKVGGTIVHIHNTTGEWNDVIVDQEHRLIRNRCFDLDEHDVSHVVYVDGSSDTVYYMTDRNGSWTSEPVAVITGISDAPISLTVNDGPIIGLFDPVHQELCIYQRTNNGFNRIALPGTFPWIYSLNVISNGSGIYYYAYQEEYWSVANNATGNWITQQVNTAQRGEYEDTAIDLIRSDQGRIYIGITDFIGTSIRHILEVRPNELIEIGTKSGEVKSRLPSSLAVDSWGYLQDFTINYRSYSKGYTGYLYDCRRYLYDPIGPEYWEKEAGPVGDVSLDIDSKGNGVVYLNTGYFVFLDSNNTFSDVNLNHVVVHELDQQGQFEPATMKLNSRDYPVVYRSEWGNLVISRKHPPTVDLQLKMPHIYFEPGREFYLDLNTLNSGDALTDVPLWCILEIADQLYYYPDWSAEPKYQTIDIPAGESTIQLIEPFSWPDTGEDIIGRNHFYAAFMNSDNTEFLDISSGPETWTFNYGPAL